MHLISIIVEKIIFFYYKNFIIIILSFCSNIFGQKNRCVRAYSVIRENGKLYNRIARKTSCFILLMLLSAYSFHAFADEIRFSQIASSLEQKLLIKNDVIESLNVGVSQLEKACDLEKDKDNNGLKYKNSFLEKTNSETERLYEFIKIMNISVNATRDNALKTVRNKCGILGQIMGTSTADKQLCESTKNKIEFIDRLKPSLEKNIKLENLNFNTLSTLFEIETAGCTTQNFSEKVYTEMQSVLKPLDASIEQGFEEALELME